jgi:hypothetical protein
MDDNIKVGDVVTCIERVYCLTQGKQYLVVEISNSSLNNTLKYHVCNDAGITFGYYCYRFAKQDGWDFP